MRQLIAEWPLEPPPTIVPRCAGSVEREELDSADALVILTDGQSDSESLSALIALLQETTTALLAIPDEQPSSIGLFEYAEAMVLPRDTEPRLLAAALAGLCHRQREIHRLSSEMALMQRHQGGLRSQMAKVHDELQLAAMVQREFLPRELPVLPGLELAAMWRPAHYVSGDLYDAVRLDEEHVGLFIADSIGHGVPAALMTMIICRSLMVKEVSGHDYRIIPPSEVLSRLNLDMIQRQGQTTRFATAVYAVVNCRTREMTIAGAGHPPPLLLRGDGSTEQLTTPGGLLGIFEDERFEQVEVILHREDRLILYSDGFEQAFPASGGDGYERRLPTTRYLEEFEQLRSASTPQEMITRIRTRLDGQSGSLHQADDLTMLCLLSCPPADQPSKPTVASAAASAQGAGNVASLQHHQNQSSTAGNRTAAGHGGSRRARRTCIPPGETD